MSEWWTYRPADFLMFSPRVYWRLFELHNDSMWPAQPLVMLAGLAWVVSLWRAARRDALHIRFGLAGLAACWAAVSWFFLLDRYAPINWAARAFAFGFAAQAVGLALLALYSGLQARAPGPARRIGVLLCLWGLLGHPLMAPAFGQPWQQAEVFGLAPDPTAIATSGFLLAVMADAPAPRSLLGVLHGPPVAWCGVSTATLWAMGSARAWVVLAAMLLTVAGLVLRARSSMT